jgi:hypothetical protein
MHYVIDMFHVCVVCSIMNVWSISISNNVFNHTEAYENISGELFMSYQRKVKAYHRHTAMDHHNGMRLI